MSALDQAFIKAFAKEPAAAPPRSAPRELPREAVASRAAANPHVDHPRFEELYDDGTFYRVDAAREDRAVPAMHTPADRKIPRRLQRRSAARMEIDLSLPMQPEPVVQPQQPPTAVPPRRNWSRSMLEIARQLAQFDLLNKSEADLPPEIVALDPPEVKEQPATEQPAPVVKPEWPELKLPPSAPPAVAQLWTIDEAIVTPTVVALTDAQSWLAQPLAPSVACHENVTEWAKSAAPPIPVAPPPMEPPTEAAFGEVDQAAKKKRKFRVDASHPRLPRPHRLPEVKPAVDDVTEASAKVEEPSAIPPQTEVAEPVVSAPVAEEPIAEKAKEPAVIEASQPTPEPVTVISTKVPKRPYVPLWEVDRFTWPPICDKLMHDPNGYFASASNKLLSVVRGGLKVLGVTGSRRGEGRTTLALCLARAAAQAGIHVALVDADFTRPQLATTLGLETAYGWQEAATGKIPLSEAAVKSLADRVTVLPLEVSTTTAPLSLADPRVTATLRATAATFELVIVDLGPLTSSSDALFPEGENCPLDAAIVVRDTRYASVNESRLIGDRLYDAGIEAVGIAENFVTQPELAFL